MVTKKEGLTMEINNNLFLLNSMYKNQNIMYHTLEKLASGKRINTASDDPAGLAISSRLKTRSDAYAIGSRNLGDGMSMLQTADGGAGQAEMILQRMRDLAVQADNGTNSSQDLQNINKEISDLKDEYDHVTKNTNFNGKNLLDNNSALNINDGGVQSNINTKDITSVAGGPVDLENIDVTASGGAQDAISRIDKALDSVTTARSSFGAEINRLTSADDFNHVQAIEAEKSRSRIEDADMVKQISDLVKNKIYNQADIATLHIMDKNSSSILKLF
jgi:flagellin